MASQNQEQSPSISSDFHLHLRCLKQALTCSMCLCLLKRATCLPCMHHFCGSCLHEPLAEEAACPRCKLPAAIRQARGSPEIDNIVNIYQSLKTATDYNSGLPSPRDRMNSSMDNNNSFQEGHPMDFTFAQMPPATKEGLPALYADATQVNKKRNRVALSATRRLTVSKRVHPPCPVSHGGADEMLEERKETWDPAYQKRKVAPSSDFDAIGSHLGVTVPSCNGKASMISTDVHRNQSVGCQAQLVSNSTLNEGTHKEEGLHIGHAQVRGVTNIVDCERESNDGNTLQTRTLSDCRGDGATTEDAQDVKHTLNKDGEQESCKLENNSSTSDQLRCAFCQTSDTVVAGPMVNYHKEVTLAKVERTANCFIVHKSCEEWAPNVYYEDGVAKNLSQEIARGQKVKCSGCGLKGAVLGCYLKRCRKSYHYPCARALPCRWDEVNFLVLCADHVSSRFPNERAQKRRKTLVKHKPDNMHMIEKETMTISKGSAATNIFPRSMPITESCRERSTKPSPSADALIADASMYVLCGSGLDDTTNELIARFLSCTSALFLPNWRPCVTHLITGIDEKGAAKRTYKYLMANLEGKWILKADWLVASVRAGQPVGEEPYEVHLDIHGMIGGPRHSRLMVASKGQGLFSNMFFYIVGAFAEGFKFNLQTLIKAAGGKLFTQEHCEPSCTVVVYSQVPDMNVHDQNEVIKYRCLEARAVASQLGAKVVGNLWVLDSIAAYELQPFE